MKRRYSAMFPLLLLSFVCLTIMMHGALAQQKRPFTLADDIGFVSFGGSEGNSAPEGAIRFSPDGSYVAIYTARGREDRSCVEDSLRFYRSRDIERFLHTHQLQPPASRWSIVRCLPVQGAISEDWRWLPDSTGVAFIENAGFSNQYLDVADVTKNTVKRLTASVKHILAFDIRDQRHYVYTVADAPAVNTDSQPPAVVGTGMSLDQLLLPKWYYPVQTKVHVWAVIDSKRVELREGIEAYVLSPDGRSLAALLPVTAPAAWAGLYPPSFDGSPYGIHPGEQVDEYVRIDLQTGFTHALTGAPTADTAGWPTGNLGGAVPSWSSDGQSLILPGTFLASTGRAASVPCIVVVNVRSNIGACVEALKRLTKMGDEPGYYFILSVNFVGDDRIQVHFLDHDSGLNGIVEYQRSADDAWKVVRRVMGTRNIASGMHGLHVLVQQGLNERPVLIATQRATTKVVWDANPQFRNIELGEARVYSWKDQEGKEWKGGLYFPVHYQPGRRYPLVVQTHGFREHDFNPSGLFPTANAARVLAASGIMVLQISEKLCPLYAPGEGPCQVAGYKAGVQNLVSQGLVDPSEVGIIGFSRTGIYVMETLTRNSFRVKAALMADANTLGYSEYLFTEDFGARPGAATLQRQYDSVIGSAPFGDGLHTWLDRAPGFNLDKVKAALLIEPENRPALLFMWETYAGLHHLHKPVDLIVININGNTGGGTLPYEHVLTNPALRLASQGSSVDWFRFWLQGYEDPNPAKAAQYKRWEGLRKLQEAGKSSG